MGIHDVRYSVMLLDVFPLRFGCSGVAGHFVATSSLEPPKRGGHVPEPEE